MSRRSSHAAFVTAALITTIASLPGVASAAACCTSATAFGVGRLRIWEDYAAGVQMGTARSVGQWNDAATLKRNAPDFSDGVSRVEPWAIVRLHERVQVQAWAPLLLNDRRGGGQSQLAGGIGDVGAAARFEVLSIGEYAGLPAFAVTLGALAPTGRRPEETSAPLFAGTTGRGAWGGSLALEIEYASLPWFVRLDAGVSAYLPFRRPDTGASQQYGRILQAALSAGNEVLPEKLVLAVAVSGEWEAPLGLDGAEVPRSKAYSYSLAGSLSWLVDPHWTLVTSLTSNVWPDGAGMNRDARVGFNLGVRHGHF